MDLAMFLVWLPVFMVAMTLHEFAHAWSASLLGDDFARRQGRVSFWPGRHLSMMGTLAILVLHFGWGKPVPVNLYNFKHPKRDYLLTSLAGPGTNLLTIGACYLLMLLTRQTYAFGSGGWAIMIDVAHILLTVLAVLSAILATINLLPVPPLDGSKIWPCIIPGLKPTLKPRTTWLFLAVLLVMMYTDSLRPVFDTAIGAVTAILPVSDRTRVEDLTVKGQRAAEKAYALEEADQADRAAAAGAEAEDLFTQALAIDPDSVDLYQRRARVRLDLDRPEDALADLDRALAGEPYNASTYTWRARALLDLHRLDDALEAAERAVELDPTAPVNYEWRAKVLENLDRPDEARGDWKTARRLRKRMRATMPSSSGQTGEPTSAMPNVDRLIDRGQQAADEGRALAEGGKADQAAAARAQAEDLFTQGLAIAPDSTDLHYRRATVRLGLNRPQEALGDIDRALAGNPDDASAHLWRTQALLDLDRLDDALGAADRAVKLDPGDPVSYRFRATVLKRLNRPTEARDDWEKAARLLSAMAAQTQPATGPSESHVGAGAGREPPRNAQCSH